MSDATRCIACGSVGTVTTCAGQQRPCVPALPVSEDYTVTGSAAADEIMTDILRDGIAAMDAANQKMVGDLSSFNGFDGLLAALGGHVGGYTEIASEGGVHWYQRDDDSA